MISWVYIFVAYKREHEMQMVTSFECNSVIRGYHIYKEIWEASYGETFHCMRETGNSFDPFAVARIGGNALLI